MKLLKRLFVLVLIPSLFLTGCDDGGFSAVKSDETNQQTSTISDDMQKDNNDSSNTHSGSSGNQDDDHGQSQNVDNESTNGGTSSGNIDNPVVDIGNQITNFKFYFESYSENYYVNVSFESDPFDKRYDFSYYTVNDVKLEKPEYRYKEMIGEKETYKLYLGELSNGTYVVKFYNSSNIQYGKANVQVKIKIDTFQNSYVAMSFNIVRIRYTAMYFAVQNTFKKIGDFFANLFNSDRISL